MSLSSRFLPLALIAAAVGLALPARADTVIDNWATVQAPAAPKLEDVTIDPKTTALLMLDFLKQGLLKTARDKKMLVVYTMFQPAKPADILPPVAPTGKEPTVTAFLDKFLGTDLDKVLKKNHIKTVIVVGSATNGAVLFTATSAFFHSYNVVVPIDGTSARAPYADQSAIYTLANAPVIAGKIHLTLTNMLKW
jgi:nicotinamidase-related amidase